jgi:CRP/FNR family cyclic AMP-dependent transcriptional regulator
VKIFSSVPEAQLADLATITESVDYDAGDMILRKGDMGNSMYIVATGKVRISDGNKELGLFDSRTVFGELTALDPEPRAANVKALEDCVLQRLDGESLYELISGNKEVTRGIIQVLCEYTRQHLALARETN